MIILIFKMILLGVMWVMMVKISTAEDMIFEKLGEWGKKKVKEGHKIFEGLIVCEWCLGNIHGILFVFPLALLLGILPDNLVWWKYLCMYPFYLGGACFISGMLWNIYLTMNQKKDYYESGVHFHNNVQKYYYNQNKKDKDLKTDGKS